MAPFGFIDNGLDNPHLEEEEVDEYGNRWTTVVRDFNSDW